MFELAYEFDWSIPFRDEYFDMLVTGVKLTLILLVTTTISFEKI